MKRFVDGIQRKAPKLPDAPPRVVESEKPSEPQQKPITQVIPPPVIPQVIQKPTTPISPSQGGIGKRRNHRWWLWFLGVFLIVIIVFIVLFWQALLSPKPSLIKLFLGLNGRYLILFQNNTELRPSGGFIGSFAEVEIKHGKIKNYYVETNIWKKDKIFVKQTCVTVPKPFIQTWGKGNCFALRDSNWSPDFQDSAQNVEWYYKQEGGENVDGIIAIDTNFFTDLLKIIGPIEMPKYNLILTPENFTKEVQYEVERDYWSTPENWVTNEPKTILKEMMPEVISRLKNYHLWPQILKMTLKNLKEKHLLFALKDPRLSKIVHKNNWGGEVRDTSADYLYINNANLGGFKSSQNVKQNITLKSIVKYDGSIVNTLTIVRKHEGDGLWPDAINKNYTRILVPEGSLIESKKNIEEVDTTSELGKTIYGFWTTVSPGKTKTFEITYRLPFKKPDNYSLLIQKQPGGLPDDFTFLLENISNWKWQGEVNEDKNIEINLTK